MNTLFENKLIQNTISEFISCDNKDFSKFFLNPQTHLLDIIHKKNEFDFNLNKKKATALTFSISFDTITFSNNYALAFTTLSHSTSSTNIKSHSNSYLCFILSKISNFTWLIDYIISKERFPSLFNNLEKNTLNYDVLLEHNLNLLNHYSSLLKNHNRFYTVSPITSPPNRNKIYDDIAAREYAERHALSYNNAYKSFNDIGGDCTNFASQVIHAGGVPYSSTWKPYSNTWLRVDELRNYLIYNNLATETTTPSPDSIGSIVQFFHPERKAWTHSGIITYFTENGALYCCHSYDKLNYPLNFAYPSIYPKIRIITPF